MKVISVIIAVLITVAFMLLTFEAMADRYLHKPNITYLVPPPTVEEVVNVTEIVNTTNIENYTPDRCQGVAEAQAAANNKMYPGTSVGQLSLAGGGCGDSLASSVQFGKRINNNAFVSGSWGHNWLHGTDAAGIGLLLLFK